MVTGLSMPAFSLRALAMVRTSASVFGGCSASSPAFVKWALL
jgi:hypothetical protein